MIDKLSEKEISYTYMLSDQGAYAIFKPDGDIINPQRLCEHLNALERALKYCYDDKEVMQNVIDVHEADNTALRKQINDPSGAWADLERKLEIAEERVEGLESEGHSMDCDLRKDSTSPPDCSCGWTQRIGDLATSREDQEDA